MAKGHYLKLKRSSTNPKHKDGLRGIWKSDVISMYNEGMFVKFPRFPVEYLRASAQFQNENRSLIMQMEAQYRSDLALFNQKQAEFVAFINGDSSYFVYGWDTGHKYQYKTYTGSVANEFIRDKFAQMCIGYTDNGIDGIRSVVNRTLRIWI